MQKDYPVGKAQSMVLKALGMTAEGFNEAEQMFKDLNIVVNSVRVGRTSEPRVSLTERYMAEGEYFDSKLAPLAQWMNESDAAQVTPTK